MITKNEIRKLKKEERRLMSKEDVLKKSNLACEIFLQSNIYKESKTLMLYMPLGNEINPMKIVEQAYRDDKKVIFPVTDEQSGIITPIYASENTEFSIGAFSVSEPKSNFVADKKKIDVVLVPGIAFDKKGNRIGFGKGCYDQFLYHISAVTVGFCYESQLCPLIPSESTDYALDFIVTEKEIIDCF